MWYLYWASYLMAELVWECSLVAERAQSSCGWVVRELSSCPPRQECWGWRGVRELEEGNLHCHSSSQTKRGCCCTGLWLVGLLLVIMLSDMLLSSLILWLLGIYWGKLSLNYARLVSIPIFWQVITIKVIRNVSFTSQKSRTHLWSECLSWVGREGEYAVSSKISASSWSYWTVCVGEYWEFSSWSPIDSIFVMGTGRGGGGGGGGGIPASSWRNYSELAEDDLHMYFESSCYKQIFRITYMF